MRGHDAGLLDRTWFSQSHGTGRVKQPLTRCRRIPRSHNVHLLRRPERRVAQYGSDGRYHSILEVVRLVEDPMARIGYAWVSSVGQSLAVQRERLRHCDKIVEEQ